MVPLGMVEWVKVGLPLVGVPLQLSCLKEQASQLAGAFVW